MGEPGGVVERGVLTAPAEVWQVAVRRAEVIGRLATGDAVGHVAADAAAAELGVSRRRVYELLRRWRAGSGLVSDLIPGRSSGGRGREQLAGPVEAVIREVLRTRYLTRQRRSMAAVHREIARTCLSRGLPVPSRGAVVRRAAKLDPVAVVAARQGPDAARERRSAARISPWRSTCSAAPSGAWS
nr:DNA-binding domain-containing protein [Frankia sp. Cr1]